MQAIYSMCVPIIRLNIYCFFVCFFQRCVQLGVRSGHAQKSLRTAGVYEFQLVNLSRLLPGLQKQLWSICN